MMKKKTRSLCFSESLDLVAETGLYVGNDKKEIVVPRDVI